MRHNDFTKKDNPKWVVCNKKTFITIVIKVEFERNCCRNNLVY
jgi:hypothetical protein